MSVLVLVFGLAVGLLAWSLIDDVSLLVLIVSTTTVASVALNWVSMNGAATKRRRETTGRP